jgi:hypothetical protein
MAYCFVRRIRDAPFPFCGNCRPFLFVFAFFVWLAVQVVYNISRNYYKISSLRFVDGGTEELDV